MSGFVADLMGEATKKWFVGKIISLRNNHPASFHYSQKESNGVIALEFDKHSGTLIVTLSS